MWRVTAQGVFRPRPAGDGVAISGIGMSKRHRDSAVVFVMARRVGEPFPFHPETEAGMPHIVDGLVLTLCVLTLLSAYGAIQSLRPSPGAPPKLAARAVAGGFTVVSVESESRRARAGGFHVTELPAGSPV
ncbi:hypothetical protein [Nonomuraea sp. JJY05]|jgi:hypothetical protein|uniref:hypothetical protein n=1 Tax=Nonomuraea sp. JJY05 TaxID=3350255 RepID=UPI00373F3C4D